MLRITASKHDVFRILTAKPRLPYEEVWHLWKVVFPRRSITGRLIWGTVLRRRDDGQWIYKKYTEGFDPAEYRGSARTLVAKSKKAVLSSGDELTFPR